MKTVAYYAEDGSYSVIDGVVRRLTPSGKEKLNVLREMLPLGFAGDEREACFSIFLGSLRQKERDCGVEELD